MADIKDEKARWQKQVYEKAKTKGGERHPSFVTSSGVEHEARLRAGRRAR